MIHSFLLHLNVFKTLRSHYTIKYIKQNKNKIHTDCVFSLQHFLHAFVVQPKIIQRTHLIRSVLSVAHSNIDHLAHLIRVVGTASVTHPVENEYHIPSPRLDLHRLVQLGLRDVHFLLLSRLLSSVYRQTFLRVRLYIRRVKHMMRSGVQTKISAEILMLVAEGESDQQREGAELAAIHAIDVPAKATQLLGPQVMVRPPSFRESVCHLCALCVIVERRSSTFFLDITVQLRGISMQQSLYQSIDR